MSESLYDYYKQNGVKGLFIKPDLETINHLAPIKQDEYSELESLIGNIDIKFKVVDRGELQIIKADLKKNKPQAYLLTAMQSKLPVLIFINSKCEAYFYFRILEKNKPEEKREKALKLKKSLEGKKLMGSAADFIDTELDNLLYIIPDAITAYWESYGKDQFEKELKPVKYVLKRFLSKISYISILNVKSSIYSNTGDPHTINDEFETAYVDLRIKFTYNDNKGKILTFDDIKAIRKYIQKKISEVSSKLNIEVDYKVKSVSESEVKIMFSSEAINEFYTLVRSISTDNTFSNMSLDLDNDDIDDILDDDIDLIQD